MSSNSDDRERGRISDYTQSSRDLNIYQGLAVFDTLKANLKTHKLDSGDKYVFVYKQTGVTTLDANDWEAKYTETLIFQVDTNVKDFEFCDKDLQLIDCKYYWICIAKEIKKEIRDLKIGCIKGNISSDSTYIDIKVNSEFGFGGLMEKGDKRTIKYQQKIDVNSIK